MSELLNANSIIELVRILKKQGIPSKDYSLYVNQLIERKARQYCVPLNGNFELTPYCNLDCKMCYVHLEGSQYRSGILTVAQWKSIIRQAYDLGMRRAALTGGECLTYPGFDDVYLYLKELGIDPGVMSNGILINEKRIEFFKKYPPRIIQISLYGSSDDAYERVTGHRVSHIVERHIRMLSDEGFTLKLAITPNSYMFEDIRALIEKAESFHVEYKINPRLNTPRENTGRQAIDLTNDQYVELFKVIKDLNHKQLTPIDPEELPDESTSGIQKYGISCGAGRSTFSVYSDGSMGPCLALDNLKAFPLIDGFANAWKTINEMVSNYPVPLECSDCVYYERCLHCPALHKNILHSGHCNKAVCERTKAMISAGVYSLPKSIENLNTAVNEKPC